MHPEAHKICPNAQCQSPMVKQDHSGVIIDVCPRDGAVALDHGELPLIVSQVSSAANYRPIPAASFATHRASHASGHGHHGHRHHGGGSMFDGLFGSS